MNMEEGYVVRGVSYSLGYLHRQFLLSPALNNMFLIKGNDYQRLENKRKKQPIRCGILHQYATQLQ